MIWSFLFAAALLGGWLASWRVQGGTEARTMCVLTAVWVGTIFSYNVFEGSWLILAYVVFDIIGLGMLFWIQNRNWQWEPAALFTAMLLTHFIFVSGQTSYLLSSDLRPWLDILAVLGYLQIASVCKACWGRLHHGSGAYYRWGAGSNWVLRRLVLGDPQDEAAAK